MIDKYVYKNGSRYCDIAYKKASTDKWESLTGSYIIPVQEGDILRLAFASGLVPTEEVEFLNTTKMIVKAI